jgi:hypothetical protein
MGKSKRPYSDKNHRMPREDSEHPLWFGRPTNQARSEGREKAKRNRIHFAFEEKQEQAFCSGGVTMLFTCDANDKTLFSVHACS